MHPQPGFELRPRTIGELLDLVFRVYRRGFKTFALLGILVTTLSALVGTLLQFVLVDPSTIADLQGPSPDFGAMGQIYLAAIAAGLVNVFLYGIGVMSITAATEATLLGRQVGARSALAGSWRRTIWAGLTSVVLAVLTMVCALPCLVPAVPVVIVFSLSVPLVYLERMRPIRAMQRSFELITKRGTTSLSVESNWVRVAIMGFVSLVIVYLFSVLVSLPLVIATMVAALRDSGLPPTAMGPQVLPLHLQLPLQLISAILQGIFISIGIIPWTVIYYDVRTRHEGLDLELQVRALGPPDPADAPGS